MSVETSIVTRATTHGGLSALIGTRIFPEDPGRKAGLPYLTYMRVGTIPNHAMGRPVDCRSARFQIDGYAATKVDALALEVQILAAFDQCGVQGSIVDSIWTDQRDLTELLDASAQMRCSSFDFEVWYV